MPLYILPPAACFLIFSVLVFHSLACCWAPETRSRLECTYSILSLLFGLLRDALVLLNFDAFVAAC